MPKNRSLVPSLIFSIFMVLAGVALVLDNFGIIHVRELFRYWPVVFIVMGVTGLNTKRGLTGLTWSLLVIACGVLLLLGIHRYPYIDWHLAWPFLLIGAGLLSLAQALDRRKVGYTGRKFKDFIDSTSSEPSLQEFAVFSGAKRRIDSQNFSGGDIVAVFGGFEIDLRRAAIAPGESAIIDMRVVFGGVEIRVPEEWKVVIRGLAVFGGFEDKTVPPRTAEGVEPPKLILAGHVVFGGVSVEN